MHKEAAAAYDLLSIRVRYFYALDQQWQYVVVDWLILVSVGLSLLEDLWSNAKPSLI